MSHIIRRLPQSPEDQRLRRVTYELDNGNWLTVDAREVALHGIAVVASRYGVKTSASNGRIPVRQCGVVIGTVPADFDPMFIKSKSLLYDPRPGDFLFEGNAWSAAPMLGAGDFEAIEGFAPA